jgi:hypothetical protein
MRLDYAQYLADQFFKVEDGELPESAIRRIFWFGHTILKEKDDEITNPQYWCLNCKLDFHATKGICPQCGAKEYGLDKTYKNIRVHQIGFSPIATWKCNFCQHIWESEEGESCPKCQKRWDDKV